MELMTRIDIPKSEWKIGAEARVLLVGSCFADEVGQKMITGGLRAMVNPFGTLYNPASIAASLLRSISEREYGGDAAELVRGEADGAWHSWMHHSRFSSTDKEALLTKMNRTMHEVAAFLREADVLVVTLGTAIAYRLKETGMLVANCHKQADGLFVRECMTAYDIADQWQMLLRLLESVNPKLRIVFTISPIRHRRDGFHANQVSKGILLQAVDALVRGAADVCSYFPAYEIMLDELRDYRFYAADMVHPSEVAVEYIWQRFQDTYFDNKTKDAAAKATKEWRRRQHRTIVK
ncbi:MAG: GSCFA domain-containing protein [Prevotellaceae bacterium]|nr:GSCFA domain-containing protein [Prevotellaceae bacterium]